MRLRAGAATDIGRVRKRNEDAHAARPAHAIFVVCDGMGGARGGDIASRLAVDTVLGALQAGPESDSAPPVVRADVRTATRDLVRAVERANQAILDRARDDDRHEGMGTTVVAVCVAEETASVAHVGDSRAYLWRDGELRRLTSDHSVVQAQVDEGLLAQEDSLKSAHQNLLLRALGHVPDVEVDVTEVPLRHGDCLLLCTDGLTRMVSEVEMTAVVAALREPQAICDALVAAANRGGGPDNITVVAIEARQSWWSRVWPSRREA